jgi:hypothetical protein
LRIDARIAAAGATTRLLAEVLWAAREAARAGAAGAARRVIVVGVKASGKDQDHRTMNPSQHVFI